MPYRPPPCAVCEQVDIPIEATDQDEDAEKTDNPLAELQVCVLLCLGALEKGRRWVSGGREDGE